MTFRLIAATGFTVVLVASACFAPAQQGTTKRNYDAEIEAAQPDAKDAAGFEFQGTLVRTRLLPVSRSDAATGAIPTSYVTNPGKAPPRDADPARVFDNLYFVGERSIPRGP